MSFERLVKEIDVLTFNSRSVLNALIRSVLRYGSDRGYSVVRSGETLTLSRQHIYLLYRFYNEWATYDFDKENFDQAKENVIENFLSTEDEELIDEALITHSKILYLNSDNKAEEDSYWFDKLIDTTDKSMLLNSSPIPINLRTPVMDENMNTTKYNQYETYLLPIGYYRSQILGYYDDGNDYSAGGKSWAFNVNESFTVNSPTIVLGGCSYVAIHGVERFKKRCVNSSSSKTLNSYSLCYGYNTKIEGSYGTVGGVTNFVIDANYAHNISSCSMLQGNFGGIYAGHMNQVHAKYGATAGGQDLVVLGEHGFAANQFNTVGYYGMAFDIPNMESLDTSCIQTINVCDSDEEVITTSYNPANIIRIYDNKNQLTPFGFQQLSVGDYVIIYDQTINNKNYLTWHGMEFKHQYAQVTGVSSGTGYHDIVLSANVTYSEYGVNGGKISKVKKNDQQTYYYGANSTALNYATIACGYNQTVTGLANNPLVNPNFIVGTGYIPSGDAFATQYIHSSYITSKIYRETGFAVARDYFFGAIGSYIEYGAVRDGVDRDGQRRWVHTSNLAKQGDMYFEYTEGTVEHGFAEATELNPDLTNYSVYHTNHIGLSNTKMSIGRYTTRRINDNCIGAINFYDKDWFNDQKDVNGSNQPRNTIIEMIAQNGVRELKSNINITNGFVTSSGYISTTRYNPTGSYGVWMDNPVYASMYSNTEYIAISSANTLSLYSSNNVRLTSLSLVTIDSKYFRITSTTNTLGTLSLTGNAKSHAFWFGGPDDGDPVRCMYGGFLINNSNNMQAKPYIIPNAFGLDEFLRGSASDHIFSSVGGDNDIPYYQKDTKDEAVQLHIPGPSYKDNIHPFITRYKKAEYDSEGKETVAEILKVNKLALLDDIQYKNVWYAKTISSTPVYRRVADIILPAGDATPVCWRFDILNSNFGSYFGGEWNVWMSANNLGSASTPSGTGTSFKFMVTSPFPETSTTTQTVAKTACYLKYTSVATLTTLGRIEIWLMMDANSSLTILQKSLSSSKYLEINSPSISSSYYFDTLPETGMKNLIPSSSGTTITTSGTLNTIGWLK